MSEITQAFIPVYRWTYADGRTRTALGGKMYPNEGSARRFFRGNVTNGSKLEVADVAALTLSVAPDGTHTLSLTACGGGS